MKPFKTVPLLGRSLMQQVFGQHPEANAVIELNNMLAENEINHISPSAIEDIQTRFDIELVSTYRLNLEEFYAVYLNHCLKNGVLADAERSNLAQLKKVLKLSDAQVQNLHVLLGENIYRQAFQKAVADGTITENEDELLITLAKDLLLPKSVTDKISSDAKKAYIEQRLLSFAANQMISPEEEKELEMLSKRLNTNITMDSKNAKLFELMKRFWALERMELPTIGEREILQKGEECYLFIPKVTMYDTPTSQRVTSVNLNSAKGVYLQSVSDKPLVYGGKKTFVAVGDLYLTNKRIIFDGPEKNSYIKFEKIMSISAFTEGVKINKEAGNIPYFEFKDRVDSFAVILERLLRNR